ncbi:plastocyanin/azurin family copper-binding protein [Robertmurraya massiliosenegalensis]|uniref:plastocyanin/azurin family copper-binding protein n=1 Tax=Robertmurraya massiliosenegalensis TaxID=1287657 RepID=UPI000556B237|nr:plastocyanin/azurin family copper-binding protein [Robertmurraya massiliosenegalensis]
MHNKKWLIKPFSAFLFLLIYLVLGSQIDKGIIFSKSETYFQENHSTHNRETLQKEYHHVEISINVQTLQFTYIPSKIVLKKGQRVSVTLNNSDSIEHDLEIKNFPTINKISEKHEGHSIKNQDLHLHASAEEQTEMSFTPTKAGTYEFYCTVPGHKEKGMVGLIIVT